MGLAAAGVAALALGLALLAAGGWPGKYRAGEAFSLVLEVPAGADTLRVEKRSGPVPGGWMHAQYLPQGEVVSVPLAPEGAAGAAGAARRPVAVVLNLWDPGIYRVVAGEGEGVSIRVGLPASRFWASVGLAAAVWALGLLAGWTSRQIPRPGAGWSGPARPNPVAGAALTLGLLLLVPAAAAAHAAGTGAGHAGVSPVSDRRVFALPLGEVGQVQGAPSGGPATLEIVHPEHGLLLRAPVRPDGVLRYRFPEGALYQVRVGNGQRRIDVPAVAPTPAELARGMAVLMAFFLAGGLAGVGLGQGPQASRRGEVATP